MYPNAYAVEQLSRQVVGDRLAEARRDQKGRLAQAVSRELRRLSRRNRDEQPARRAAPAV